MPHPRRMPNGLTSHSIERWIHKKSLISVLTAVEPIVPEGQTEPRPEYHISMVRLVRLESGTPVERVDSSDAQSVLGMFGADGFLEDNHVPGGRVRNFWRPVAEPAVGQVCACVDDEPAMREDKGDYVWRGTP